MHRKKQYTQGSILSTVSGTYSGSWNISSMYKGRLLCIAFSHIVSMCQSYMYKNVFSSIMIPYEYKNWITVTCKNMSKSLNMLYKRSKGKIVHTISFHLNRTKKHVKLRIKNSLKVRGKGYGQEHMQSEFLFLQ